MTEDTIPTAALLEAFSRFEPEQRAAFIEIAIVLEDVIAGDPDLEDDDPLEHDGTDQGDQSWTEGSSLRGKQLIAGPEDAEEDDPPEEDDPSGQSDEDGVNTGTRRFGWGGPSGAGCPISDDDSEHDGREEEAGV